MFIFCHKPQHKLVLHSYKFSLGYKLFLNFFQSISCFIIFSPKKEKKKTRERNFWRIVIQFSLLLYVFSFFTPCTSIIISRRIYNFGSVVDIRKKKLILHAAKESRILAQSFWYFVAFFLIWIVMGQLFWFAAGNWKFCAFIAIPQSSKQFFFFVVATNAKNATFLA